MALAKQKPVLSTRFVLELDGASQMTFNQVTGMTMSTTAAETELFASGGRGVVKNPGNQEPTELNLTRQLDADTTMWDWFQKLVEGAREWRNGSLIIYGGNAADEELVRYNFVEAWPSKVSVSGLDAAGKDTLTEETTLVCFEFTRVK
jgi:phage tail-like protein